MLHAAVATPNNQPGSALIPQSPRSQSLRSLRFGTGGVGRQRRGGLKASGGPGDRRHIHALEPRPSVPLRPPVDALDHHRGHRGDEGAAEGDELLGVARISAWTMYPVFRSAENRPHPVPAVFRSAESRSMCCQCFSAARKRGCSGCPWFSATRKTGRTRCGRLSAARNTGGTRCRSILQSRKTGRTRGRWFSAPHKSGRIRCGRISRSRKTGDIRCGWFSAMRKTGRTRYRAVSRLPESGNRGCGRLARPEEVVAAGAEDLRAREAQGSRMSGTFAAGREARGELRFSARHGEGWLRGAGGR